MIEPNACRWCALPERVHYTRWESRVQWHVFVQPTDEQRLTRMWERRKARL